MAAYRILDPNTNETIAEFPLVAFRTVAGALHAAAVQARRHAAAGKSVVLTGEGKFVLYNPPPPPPEPLPAVRDEGRKPRRRRKTVAQLELPLESKA